MTIDFDKMRIRSATVPKYSYLCRCEKCGKESWYSWCMQVKLKRFECYHTFTKCGGLLQLIGVKLEKYWGDNDKDWRYLVARLKAMKGGK